MGKINLARVILGGLLAGLIINVGEYILNVFIVGDEMAARMAELNLPAIGPDHIVWFVLLTFIYGILLVWLYAAIRPRFGAGVTTAVIAGLALWVAGAITAVSMTIAGFWPAGVTLIGLIWSLFELPIASIAGAWLYREDVRV